MQDFFSSNAVQFVWGLSAFAVFVLILVKLGVKQVLAAVDAREAKIAGDLKEAEDTAARAKKVQAELEAKMKGAEHEIQGMMAEARRDGEAHKIKMIEQGRAELDDLRHRALREIEAARHAAIVGLRKEIAEISVAIAEKAVAVRLDQAKHEELVVAAIDAFEAQNHGAR
jgi:F-type H+-transporting ATPase subunit b